MKRFRRLWIAPFLGGFIVTAVLLSRQPSKVSTRQSEPQDAKKAPPRSIDSSAVAQTDISKPKSAVEKFVEGESLRVGQPDKNPDESFRRLKRVAKKLRKNDFAALLATALNSELNTDQRFLSAYLLALSDDSAAAEPLMTIATTPLPESPKSSPIYAEELAVRTQALEGLAKFHRSGRPVLTQFLAKQENAFLAQQAQRLIRERKAKR